MMKKCTKCQKHKSLTMFYKKKGGRLGVCCWCIDCKKAYDSKYRALNKDKLAKKSKRYRDANPEYYAKKGREWRENNPDKVKKNRLAYFKRLSTTPFTLTYEQWNNTLKACKNKCVYCGNEWEAHEHFLSLTRGGSFSVNNIVPSCTKCNKKKGTKQPFDYIRTLPLPQKRIRLL